MSIPINICFRRILTILLPQHELIAVHQTNTPQFYPECAQLVITGSGSSSPTSEYLTSIPGYGTLADANIKVDIYSEAAKTTTCWDVPGPPVWGGVSYSTTGNCGSGTSTPASSTVKPASSSSTKPASSTSSTKPASSTSSTKPVSSTATGGAALYGQCGGQGWYVSSMHWYESFADNSFIGLDQPLALRERAKPQASTIASACHETSFVLIIFCDISMHEFKAFRNQFLKKKVY